MTPLDVDRLGAVAAGNPGLFLQVVAIFQEDCPLKVEEAHEALGRRDSVRLARVAHRLRGAFVSLFADEAVRLASHLEQLARYGHFESAVSVLNELTAEAARVVACLQVEASVMQEESDLRYSNRAGRSGEFVSAPADL